jgi:hypothetical protein
MKYVTCICDNCKTPIHQDVFWTPEYEMNTGRDLCIHCQIIQGMDISQNKNISNRLAQ